MLLSKIHIMLPRTDSFPNFSDVADDQYYTAAIQWAKQTGIISGYLNGTFGPDDSISREQLANIIWNYAKYKKYDVKLGEDTNILSFRDASSISEYAIPAFQWACGSKVINGQTDNTLVPKGNATRAEVAKVLMQFITNVSDKQSVK